MIFEKNSSLKKRLKIAAVLFIFLVTAVVVFTATAYADKIVEDVEKTLNFNFGVRTGTYTGQVVNGLPHGRGVFTSVNTDGTSWNYKGEFEAGHFHGEGFAVWESGEMQQGTFVNDFLEGRGRSRSINTLGRGFLYYEGYFRAGQFHGEGRVYTQDGALVQSGEWRDGTLFRIHTPGLGDVQRGVNFFSSVWNIVAVVLILVLAAFMIYFIVRAIKFGIKDVKNIFKGTE